MTGMVNMEEQGDILAYENVSKMESTSPQTIDYTCPHASYLSFLRVEKIYNTLHISPTL